LILSLCS